MDEPSNQGVLVTVIYILLHLNSFECMLETRHVEKESNYIEYIIKFFKKNKVYIKPSSSLHSRLFCLIWVYNLV